MDKGHYYLQYFVEKQGIPVFKQIPDALTYVCHVLKKGIRLRELYQGTFCPIQTKRDKKEFRDIYLGGSNCAISNWRQEIAIPILKYVQFLIVLHHFAFCILFFILLIFVFFFILLIFVLFFILLIFVFFFILLIFILSTENIVSLTLLPELILVKNV